MGHTSAMTPENHDYHSLLMLNLWNIFKRRVQPSASENFVDGESLDIPTIVAIARYDFFSCSPSRSQLAGTKKKSPSLIRVLGFFSLQVWRNCKSTRFRPIKTQ
jgi:hypothetical protein